MILNIYKGVCFFLFYAILTLNSYKLLTFILFHYYGILKCSHLPYFFVLAFLACTKGTIVNISIPAK